MGCLLNFIFSIPILVAVNGILGNLTVLGIAWYNGSVNMTEQFPYISTCGNDVPASCVFSQVCNIGCILALVFEVVVYDVNHATTIDNISFAFGIISSLGLSITGNFQSSAMPLVHYFGAFLAFGFGFVYLGVHVWAKNGGYCKICGIVGLVIYGVLLLTFVFLQIFQLHHYAAIFEWLTAMVFFIVYPVFYPEFRKFRDKYSKKTSGQSDTMAEEMN